MRHYIPLIAAAAILAGAGSPAEASGNVDISVVVPEVCQIQSAVLTVDETGGSASGSVFEMCNSGRSFRIIASHRPLADGEQVRINYGGELRTLNQSGISDVAQRTGPIVGDVPVTIESDGLVQGFSVSLGFTVI